MQVALPKELAQDVSLDRRRYRELCRQKRIFNARDRIIGGDPHAWDIQVQEQKVKEATEKARHETFAAEMRRNDKMACILENRQRQDHRNLCRAITDFQQCFQMPQTRREFDLSDPCALQRDLPARHPDNDVRNSISGMQRFMGEDLNFHERKKFQQEQNREWSLQQQREWQNARADHRAAEALHAQTRLQLDHTARHLQTLEGSTRKAACMLVKEFNRNQALEAGARRRREKQQEQEDNLAEITSLLRGDLLSENPQQAASSFGPHRVVPDRWKGMSLEQLQHIRLVQKQQVQEKLRLQEEERQRDMDWDRQRVQKARASLLFDQRQQRQLRELQRELSSSNRCLAQEQQLQKKYMKEVYTNRPTEDYFAQFNTQSR
ncbi:RIB43A-like with coiled-coils protein 2 [Rhynchocyon petersi]